MKRITFLAVLIVALFSINVAKAQVGVHVGLNFGTPYYAPRRVVVVQQPAYYPPAYPVYSRGYYTPYERHRYWMMRRAAMRHRMWEQRRAYNMGYRGW